jgi:phosphoribosylformylglycinamidine synthase
VWRVEVRPAPGQPDPHAQALVKPLTQQVGIDENHPLRIASAHLYLIQAPLGKAEIQQVAAELLADPIAQRYVIGSPATAKQNEESHASVEVHYQPGVMDPVAQSTASAIAEMLPHLKAHDIQVRTGRRFDITGGELSQEALHAFAQRYMANPVIQDIHLQPFVPESFPAGSAYSFRLTHVPVRDLDDAGLARLSREGHLFLSNDEMRAIRDHYQSLGREPTDIELETLAQTWSEHCVHKTLKSAVHLAQSETAGMEIPGLSSENIASRPGHTLNADGSISIDNLLKSTVAAATFKLMKEGMDDWCVSVFKDNAGIVKFDDTDGVCIKVETHNHPSAIEPYGGAATGIGGCIRDIMGTGLAARPIANTDSFAVAFPDTKAVPAGVIHPRRVLEQVVAGVRDYGNRMGIPTVNGSVYFHPDYLGNPLVFAGCVGLIPLDKCFGNAKPGDRIIALGGRTGRDGIHGATFSSAELTDTHADEFAHAVQIGNAITQKKTLDAIMAARDHAAGTLFTAITDCGAGGFSSAVGEMGAEIGANVQLANAPLKYDGLSYTEIWISEAQERMVLAVPADNVPALQKICDEFDVELCDLGQFGWGSDGDNINGQLQGEPTLVLNYHEHEVGRMAMHFVHEGIPTPVREATWQAKPPAVAPRKDGATSVDEALLALMAHPNIASKHWIIRQYDHEVQGGSVVKPLVGPRQDGPSDAAVIRPKLSSDKAIALSIGLQTGLGEKTPGGDSYWMALAAIDEAVRNAVCVGADPARIAILDNFCWPRCDDPAVFGSLVRAAEACYDGALAYRTPFVSGKDSLSNQFTTDQGKLITIPPTLLISAMGMVDDVKQCKTMDAKAPGNLLLVIGQTDTAMGGSHYAMVADIARFNQQIPRLDIAAGPANAKAVASLIQRNLVTSAHDCSDGGLLVAVAEMAMAGRLGFDLDLQGLPTTTAMPHASALFAETPSRYLLEVTPANLDAVVRALRQAKIAFGQIGSFNSGDRLSVRCPQQGRILDVSIDTLRQAWLQPLDW